MARYTAAYIGLMRAHIALGDVPAAFASAERLRARSLLDSLTEPGARIRRQVDPQLLARERGLQDELNEKANRQSQVLGRAHTSEQALAVKEELDASLVQYREVQAQIRSADPRYAALTQPQPLGLAEVQRDLLDDETLLLEYVLGDDASQVFAITPSSSRVIELPGRTEIEAAARRVHELMTARQSGPDRDHLCAQGAHRRRRRRLSGSRARAQPHDPEPRRRPARRPQASDCRGRRAAVRAVRGAAGSCKRGWDVGRRAFDRRA